ncbi:hypothetical protein HK101_008908 [Irineochytrium annulatum]|nr:hypothetical protein HK101_008908 [Irineochytrium annulatum]
MNDPLWLDLIELAEFTLDPPIEGVRFKIIEEGIAVGMPPVKECDWTRCFPFGNSRPREDDGDPDPPAGVVKELVKEDAGEDVEGEEGFRLRVMWRKEREPESDRVGWEEVGVVIAKIGFWLLAMEEADADSSAEDSEVRFGVDPEIVDEPPIGSKAFPAAAPEALSRDDEGVTGVGLLRLRALSGD